MPPAGLQPQEPRHAPGVADLLPLGHFVLAPEVMIL
jgi:hypothetical protein